MNPKFYLMVGLPASGKSTYAKQLAIQENANIHSSDSIREELFGNINNQDNNDKVFAELNRRVREDLKNGINVILDSTNTSSKRRMTFLQQELKMRYINCEKICILIATPYDKCLEQNRLRNRFVPEHVIKKMYLYMETPAYYEGWDNIQIIFNVDNVEYNISKLFERLDNIDQHNLHHRFTIGGHCKMAVAHLCGIMIEKRIKADENLLVATMMHDIGKEFTMQFKNKKGEDTEFAHFYEHHNVSAYDSLFYLRDRYNTAQILDICQLIRLHMRPFNFNESETGKDKLINLVGQEFYDRLMMLHGADSKAH